MSVIPKNGYPDRKFSGKLLEFLDKPIPLLFVASSRPMIVKVVEYFYTAVEFVEEITKEAYPP